MAVFGSRVCFLSICIKVCSFTGLCYRDSILYDLWLFLCSLGPCCGLKTFLDRLATDTKPKAAEFQMLQLFCDCTTHYVTYVLNPHFFLFKIYGYFYSLTIHKDIK